jgi:hypothetical protein
MPEQESTRTDNKKNDENAKSTISSIDKLLSMAEESEEKISKHQKDEIFIVLAVAVVTIAFFSVLFNTPWYNISFFLLATLSTLFFAAIYFLTVKLFESEKNRKKEVITFNASLGVVQEILPYYFDKMSVLEKTIYKIRLSKLDIAGTEVEQENNNSSVQN